MIDKVCCYCQRDHNNQQKCACLCNHCKSVHMLKDLVQGQCPRKSAFSEKQYSGYVPCSYCKDINIQKIEGKMQGEEVVNLDFIKLQVKNKCSKCKDTKSLPLLVECYFQECYDNKGCHDCAFLTQVPNPDVKKAHMIPTIKQMDEQQCAICLQNVKIRDQSMQLQCGHQFHFLCIAQHLIKHKRCPCCRQTDMFLEVDTEFITNYREKAGYKPPEIQLHINFQGDLVEGYESQSDYSDEQFQSNHEDNASVQSQMYDLEQFQMRTEQSFSFNQQQIIYESQSTDLMHQISTRLIENKITLTLPGNYQIGQMEMEEDEQEDFTFASNGYDDFDGLFKW